MTFVREGQSSALCPDPHVFECMGCLIVLMTEDHETLAGMAGQGQQPLHPRQAQTEAAAAYRAKKPM